MKIQVKNYTFNKASKTITFTDYASIDLDSILLITNVEFNIIIYNFADTTKGGTASTNVLTLDYNTSTMADTDKLQIFYDDVNYSFSKGQKTKANSFPIAIASDQDALSVSITGTPTVDTELITKDYDSGAGTDTVAAVGILLPKSGGSVAGGTATDPLRTDPTGTTTQPVSGTVTANAGTNLNTSALATEAGNLATIAGKDFATSAKQDIISTRTGDVTETAPATDTASSGLNGRLQRLAQRVTTLIGSILTVKTDQTTHGTTDLVAADVTKIAGTAIDANSGTKSAGTQRIVIATDQPQLTNALKVDGSAVTQPISGTFWQATQPVSVAAAVAVTDNNGTLTVDAPVGTPVYTRLSDGSAALVAQKTKANSLPVVLASDQLVLEVTGSVSNPTGGAALIASQDVGQYKFISIQFQFSGAAMNIDIFTSNDNSNWKSLYLTRSDLNPTSASTASNSPSANGIYAGALTGRYFKAEVSNSSAGSCTATVEFSAIPPNSPITYSAQTGTWNTADTGNVAHDAADSGNPVKVGAKAITSLKTTTLVSNADRTDAQSDLDGAIIVRQQFPLGDLISERVTDTGGTSTAFSNFTAVASTSNYITAIAVHNSSATNGTVDFRNGTGGSVLWTMRIPANNGSEMTCGGVPLFKTSANTALAYDVSGALSTVSISVSGFQSKV